MASDFVKLEPRRGWGPHRASFHAISIDAIGASPDGEAVITADSSCILAWRVMDGQLTPYAGMHATRSVRDVHLRLLPANRPGAWMLVMAGPDGIETRDVALKSFGPTVPMKKGATAIAASADGRTVAFATTTGDVELFVLDDNAVASKRTMRIANAQKVTKAALSPSGARLAVGGASIDVVRSDDGQPIATLTGHDDSLLSLSFVNEHRVVAIGSNRITRWTIGAEGARSFGIPGNVLASAVSPDGVRIALAGRWGLAWYDLEALTSSWLSALPTKTVAWRGNGEILAAGLGDGRLRQHRLDESVATREDCPPPSHRTERLGLEGAVISPNDRWVAIANAGDVATAEDPYTVARRLRIYDLVHGRLTCEIEQTDEKARAGNARPFAGSRSIEWYDETLVVAEDLSSIVDHSPRALADAAAFSRDGRRALTYEEEGMLALRECRSGEILAQYPFDPHGQAALSADGSMVATWDSVLTLYRVGEDEPMYRTPRHGAWVLVTPSFDNIVLLGEQASYSIDPAANFKQPWLSTPARKHAAAISPDGRLVAIDERDVTDIWLYRSDNGTRVGALRGLFSTASYLFFTSNSRSVIAITYDGFLARWDL